MESYRNNLNEMAGGEKGKGKLYGEREKLMRAYERMKNELQTYENNIGFLSISSKGGGGLIKEMERKIEKLKEEMALIVKKIDVIDENLQ
jgi:archaellum component FlaC